MMKRLCSAFAIATYAAFFFSAFGSSSSTGSNDSPKISDADIEVEFYKGLPSCTEKREGETAYVVDQEQGYVCENGKWIEDDAAVEIRSSSSSSGSNVSIDIHAEENNSASYVPEKNVPIKNKTITGFAQKGPFKAGSVVDIFELELDGKTFAQTGKSFTGKVSNDSGAFKISNVSLKSQYALLRVTGSFKSEINDESVHATLTAVTDLSKRENVNVNILTHLEYDRVLYLIGKGMNFTSAKKQAEREVLAAFGIEGNFKNTEDMDVFGETESDATLIAISKMLLAGGGKGVNRDEEELSDLLTKIALDLEENGEWENVGGRDNSPGDYCPWDNKWQIALRAAKGFIGNDDINRCGCSEEDLVCRKICHFVQSWRIVGQYCTSAVDDEIFCNWNEDYREYGKACESFSQCKKGEWFAVTSQEADTHKWSKGKDGEIKKGDETGRKYKYDGSLGKWILATTVDIDTYGWSSGKDAEIKVGESGTSYKYDAELGLWLEASEMDLEVYVCTKKKNGNVEFQNDGFELICEDGEWERVRSAGKDGEIRDGLKYDEMLGKWLDCDSWDVELGEGCTKKRDGEVKIFYTESDGEGSFYFGENPSSCNKKICLYSSLKVCEEGKWNYIEDIEPRYYKWSDGKEGEIRKSEKSDCYYKYELGKWQFTTEIEVDTYGLPVDGSVVSGNVNEDRKYIYDLDKELWRLASYQEQGGTYGILEDSRDGQTYKTVVIGDQVWMAENLNYKTEKSDCNDSCDKYGMVYDCDDALEACPLGWHLPLEDDFRTLEITVGYDNAGYMLKSVNEKNGLDVYGFSALTFDSYETRFLGNGCAVYLTDDVMHDPSCSSWGEGGFIRCLKD